MRKQFMAACLGVCLTIAGGAVAQDLVPYPPQPAAVDWPTSGWAIGALPPSAESEVSRLVDEALSGEKTDLMGETRAVVIIHGGKLVMEAYRDGFAPSTRQVSWSMAKSVTHALTGRAVMQALIGDLDTPMPGPWPDGDPRAQITWRQWLEMTDGLDYRELDAPSIMENDVSLMMYGAGRFDVAGYAVEELPPAHTPGTHWNYSTAGLHLVGWALADVIRTGDCTLEGNRARGDASSPDTACVPKERRFSDWARSELFEPLGMDAVVEFDAAGTFLGGSLVWASARDFAKFGYLHLRGGVWEGERLLPDGWVDWARTGSLQDDHNVWGAGFWITPEEGPTYPQQGATTPPWDAFSAQGHEGQSIWIVPSRDLVIVRLGLMSNARENWTALYEWNQEIARAFPEAN